jgi:hypothetical protein
MARTELMAFCWWTGFAMGTSHPPDPSGPWGPVFRH